MSHDVLQPAAQSPHELLWKKAESALLNFNRQCGDAAELLTNELKVIAGWIVSACVKGDSEREAGQSPSSSAALGCQQLVRVLGCILGRILSAADMYSITDDSRYIERASDVAQALQTVLVLHLSRDNSKTASLALAKQLQQAELLESLTGAMELLAYSISTRVTLAARSSSCAASPCGEGSKSTTVAHELLASSRQELFSERLMLLAIQICSLWPGSVYKSAAARYLMPASAKVAAALAAISGQLYRLNDQQADMLMRAAVLAAHRLKNIHQLAVRGLPGHHGSVQDWNVSTIPEYRQLLFLLLAAQTQLWLVISETGTQRQQQQHRQQPPLSALQQLWVALGYAAGQLPKAAEALLGGARTDSYSIVQRGGVSFPFSYGAEELIRQLGVCWSLVKEKCCMPSGPTAHQSLCHELRQELPQALLMMKLARQICLDAPVGHQGNLALLSGSVYSFTKCFMTAFELHVNDPQLTASPSSVIRLDQVLQLLLQFLHYSQAAKQQQQLEDGYIDRASGTGSSCSFVGRHEDPQPAVLVLLAVLTGFTVSNHHDPVLLQAWQVWGQHVTHYLEEILRQSVAAAADDGEMWGTVHEYLGTNVSKVIEAISGFNPSGVLWQQQTGMQLASSAEPDVAIANAALAQSECKCGESSIIWAIQTHSITNAAEVTATDADPGSLASPVRSNQAGLDPAACCLDSEASPIRSSFTNPDQAACGPDNQARLVRSYQAGPTSQELRLLSLMTSCCKAMMHTVQLTADVPALLIRTQQIADSVACAAAVGLQHQAQHLQLSLLLPAVRPWVSLLARCLVMMGQRLRVLQRESSKPEDRQLWGNIHRNLLIHQKHKLDNMQLHSREAARLEQLQQLQAAVQKCADDVDALRSQLAAAKAQKQQQLFKSLQPELQKRIARLRDAENSHEAAVRELQDVRQRHQSLQHDVKKTGTRAQLFEQVNSCTVAQTFAELKGSMTALISVGRVLVACLSSQSRSSHVSSDDAAAARYATLHAVLQQLTSQLMPNLVVLEGMLGLLVDISSSSDAVPDDALPGSLADLVLKGAGAKWLQQLSTEEAPAIVEVIHQGALKLIDDVVEFASKGQGQQSQGHKLSALLSSKPYQQLHDQLVSIGSELITALPHCWCCNNPKCDNLSADSELQLISGKQRICGGCTGGSPDKNINSTAARYCSVECQTQHWKQHKRVCRRLHKQQR